LILILIPILYQLSKVVGQKIRKYDDFFTIHHNLEPSISFMQFFATKNIGGAKELVGFL